MKRSIRGNRDRSVSESILLALLVAFAIGIFGGYSSADDFSAFPRRNAVDVSGWYTFDEFQERKERFSFRQTHFPRIPDAFIEIAEEEAPLDGPKFFYAEKDLFEWEDEEEELDHRFRDLSGGDSHFQYLQRHQEFPVHLPPDRKWRPERGEVPAKPYDWSKYKSISRSGEEFLETLDDK